MAQVDDFEVNKLDPIDMASARGIPLNNDSQGYVSAEMKASLLTDFQVKSSKQSALNIVELTRILLTKNSNAPAPPSVSPVADIAKKMVEGIYDLESVCEDILCLTGVDITKDPHFQRGGKFLVLVPFHGYWSSELTLPVEVLKAAGYEVDLFTDIPSNYEGKNRFPAVLPVSLDPNFRDQPRGAAQVSESESQLGIKYVLPDTAEGKALRNAKNLSELIPKRPTPSDGIDAIPDYLCSLNAALDVIGEKYSGMIIVGGSGANVDFAYNTSLQPLLQHFFNLGKPITGICYGVTAMAQFRDLTTGRPLLEGHYVTGHSNRDDWTDFTGYMNEPPIGKTPQAIIKDAEENGKWSTNLGTAGINLQGALIEAAGPTGGYVIPDGEINAVLSIRDNVKIITANTTPDGYPAALLALACIHDKGILNNSSIYVSKFNQLGVPADSVPYIHEEYISY